MTVGASKFERKENDLYETEEWATKALLRNIDISEQTVWEPSAGNHKIVNVLRQSDASVWATDVHEYDVPHNRIDDFFLPRSYFADRHSWIITNPPYGKGNRDAVRYAELALKRADNVALLLTAKFDFGKTRRHLFADNPRFAMKIALLDRIQWFEGATTGTEDHAWYVWTSQYLYVRPFMAWEGKRVNHERLL